MSALQQMLLAAAEVLLVAPTYKTKSSATGFGASVSVPAATGVVSGDLILLYIFSDKSPVTPAGYTTVASETANAYTYLHCCYKFASGADAAVTVIASAADFIRGLKIVLSGTDATNPISAATQTTYATAPQLLGGDAGHANTLLVSANVSYGSGSGAYTFSTYSTPAGLASVTERQDASWAVDINHANLVVVTADAAMPGLKDVITATSSMALASGQVGIAVNIKGRPA